MKIRSRVLLFLLVLLATMFLANCNSYSCGGFGALPCGAGNGNGSGPFGGGGGGGGSSSSAYVFAVDQGGAIDGYSLNTTAGTFATTTNYTAPVVPPNNGGVGMVVAQQQFLYAGFGEVGELYAWTINSSGSLTAISGSPYSAPFLVDDGLGVGQNNMITNPAGTMLFISDTLQDVIYVFTIGAGGVLNAVTGSPFAVPFGPMNLATDGLGNYLYAVDGNFTTHTGVEIEAYSIGTGTNAGVLTPVTGSPFVYPMWQLQGEPTGTYMIGTSGNSSVTGFSGVDDDHLYVFSIAQSGNNAGALTQVQGSPFSTEFSPLNIAVQSDADANLVYSFSINDSGSGFNGTEGYSISSTGTLSPVGGTPFTGVGEGTWGQFDQSGAFLMNYASYINEGTGTLVTQLAPLDVASSGLLTQPVATLSLVTPGFWVVTDPQ